MVGKSLKDRRHNQAIGDLFGKNLKYILTKKKLIFHSCINSMLTFPYAYLISIQHAIYILIFYVKNAS